MIWRILRRLREQRETQKRIDQHPGMEMLRMRRVDPASGRIVDTRPKERR